MKGENRHLIWCYISDNLHCSFMEIHRGVGIVSKSTTHHHLKMLIRSGKVIKTNENKYAISNANSAIETLEIRARSIQKTIEITFKNPITFEAFAKKMCYEAALSELKEAITVIKNFTK